MTRAAATSIREALPGLRVALLHDERPTYTVDVLAALATLHAQAKANNGRGIGTLLHCGCGLVSIEAASWTRLHGITVDVLRTAHAPRTEPQTVAMNAINDPSARIQYAIAAPGLSDPWGASLDRAIARALTIALHAAGTPVWALPMPELPTPQPTGENAPAARVASPAPVRL